LREGDGEAAKFLAERGIELRALRPAVLTAGEAREREEGKFALRFLAGKSGALQVRQLSYLAEHLLLVLLASPDEAARNLLTRVGAKSEHLRYLVEAHLGGLPELLQRPAYTLNHVLGLAQEEAGDRPADERHILIALVHLEGTFAQETLLKEGATAEALRAALGDEA
jgi:ATP-dependent Clp protease ATP-binding subunit ClpA